MHKWTHVMPFNAICELGCGIAGETKMHFSTEPSLGEGLHHPELILMALAVADAEEVWKWKPIEIPVRSIRRVDTATDVADFVRRNAGPFRDLRAGEFRNRENASSAMTRPLHNGCVVQSNKRTADLRAVNVAQVANRKDER